VPLNKEQVENALPFLKEGDSVEVSKYKDEIISVDVPITVNLEVTQTDPGFKGDTATGGSKPATLETGLTVNVPLFINEGDIIKVDTRTSSYIERAN
jgi:elongation factor P